MKPRNHKPKYCMSNGKYGYTSESKAHRAVNRYGDIKRCYLCGSCGYWHTTSLETYLSNGVMLTPPIQKKVSDKDIKNRIKKLLDKKKSVKI